MVSTDYEIYNKGERNWQKYKPHKLVAAPFLVAPKIGGKWEHTKGFSLDNRGGLLRIVQDGDFSTAAINGKQIFSIFGEKFGRKVWNETFRSVFNSSG